MKTCLRALAWSLYIAEKALLEPAPGNEDPREAVDCGVYPCREALDKARETLSTLRRVGAEEMAREHTRLFIARYPVTPCPLYASWYLGEKFIMMHDTLGTIREAAERLGLEPVHGHPPDYIPLILELAWQAAQRASQGDPQAMDTLAVLSGEVLRPLLPRLAECIRSHTRLGAYQGLAEALEKIVECLEAVA